MAGCGAEHHGRAAFLFVSFFFFKVLVKLFQKLAGCGAEHHGHGVSFLLSFFLAPTVSKKKAGVMKQEVLRENEKDTSSTILLRKTVPLPPLGKA